MRNYFYCATHNLATVYRTSMDYAKSKNEFWLSDNTTLHFDRSVWHFVGGSEKTLR